MKKMNLVGQMGTSTDMCASFRWKEAMANGNARHARRAMTKKPINRIAVSMFTAPGGRQLLQHSGHPDMGAGHLGIGQIKEDDRRKNDLTDLHGPIQGLVEKIPTADIGGHQEHVEEYKQTAENCGPTVDALHCLLGEMNAVDES